MCQLQITSYGCAANTPPPDVPTALLAPAPTPSLPPSATTTSPTPHTPAPSLSSCSPPSPTKPVCTANSPTTTTASATSPTARPRLGHASHARLPRRALRLRATHVSPHGTPTSLDAASAQLAAAYTRIIDVMLGCAPLEFIPAHSTHLTNANRGFFKSTPSVDDIIARSF
ncbi:hypothetical protein SNOG_07766 [Parastagonospora nodorum SN15]|uniref:Uncharacterized protein n=1 Tax=Phaeosphaeria nodorum (strain SN15 / ATCC MYA-4574 / FGSC 10173) TaxID=321614 RepID=Q0UKE8_PHANO|nr:hypothetical protein SNOG_07766 [Parastagonospora nodorum SN15]EAT85232.1 hypothetical protein SNOG_07766 [Parastagonospora nodorum SN15]